MFTKRQLKAVIDMMKYRGRFNNDSRKRLYYEDGVLYGTNAVVALRLEIDLKLDSGVAVYLKDIETYYKTLPKADSEVVFEEMKWEKFDSYDDLERHFSNSNTTTELKQFKVDGALFDLAFRLVAHDRLGTLTHVSEHAHIIEPIGQKYGTMKVLLLGRRG